MKDGDIIVINGFNYEYSESYDRLEAIGIGDHKFTEEEDYNFKQTIACPKCLSTLFTISYASYECRANCSCGHSMAIYEG
jgi:hypothetical protein